MAELKESHAENELGSTYFRWFIKGKTVTAVANSKSPYEHHCPVTHFKSILINVISEFKKHKLINTDLIFSSIENKYLSPGRLFKGKSEGYKIRMALGILEIERLTRWTGSKRPIEYELSVPINKLELWVGEIYKE